MQRVYRRAVLRAALALAFFACACQGDAPAPTPRVEVVEAPATADIAAAVRTALARAATDRVRLVVYVGAAWCEPCRRFHDAAASGALDARFGGTRFLAYDLDRDGDALTRAGYRSTYVPLFAIPAVDGTATGRHIEGSIKGAGAVEQIAPRLEQLLAPDR